jgi:hypothetical protein
VVGTSETCNREEENEMFAERDHSEEVDTANRGRMIALLAALMPSTNVFSASCPNCHMIKSIEA